MQRTRFVSAALCIGLGLMLWPGLGCAKPVGPELRTNQFFPIELAQGDQLVYQAPNGSVVVEGPATIEWEWADGELFMVGTFGKIRVRPLEEFPHQEMTDEMIIRARARYSDVPFIVDYLEGNPSPTNQEWAVAYEAWFAARAEFVAGMQMQYKNDYRSVEMIAAEYSAQANQHPLVVPGSVRAHYAENDSESVTLFICLRGVPLHPDGSLPETELILDRNWHNPQALPTEISKEDALVLHHGINALFESSEGPLYVNLSTGLSISTKEGR